MAEKGTFSDPRCYACKPDETLALRSHFYWKFPNVEAAKAAYRLSLAEMRANRGVGEP